MPLVVALGDGWFACDGRVAYFYRRHRGRSSEWEGRLRTGGSNRSLGLLLAVVCVVIGARAYLKSHSGYLIWECLALVLAAVALGMARVLAPLRRAWMRFGTALGHLVSPLILGTVFIVVIVPVGGLMRLLGKDPLARKWDPTKPSYWIARDSNSLGPDTLREQG